MDVSAYRKFLVAAVAALGAIAVGLPEAIADDIVTLPEILAMVIAVLGAIGVWGVRNGPKPPQ